MTSQDKAQDTAEKISTAVKDNAEQASQAAQDAAQAAKAKLAEAAQVTKDKSLETTDAAKDLTSDTSKSGGGFFETAKGKVGDLSQVVTGNAQGGVKNTGGFLQATGETVKSTLGMGDKK